MMNNKYDKASYAKRKTMISAANKDNDFNPLGAVLSAKLLLITWQAMEVNYKDKGDAEKPAGSGIIRVTPAITPLGRLPPIDYSLSVYNELFIQFLDLGDLDVPYKLLFKNPKGISKTQICVRECIDEKVNSNYKVINNKPPLIA
jgi:hypothetical protein